ncbi:MAG TPA: DUF4129 domain-containing protein [Pyrinomonadaceae bacterium]|nr:DUF4129 domain-containing protein [Pyrinomonadaceae bacterium]
MIPPEKKLVAYVVRAGMLLTFALVFTTAVLPASLEDYKAKIDSARTFAIELEISLQEGEPVEPGRTRAFAAQVRRDFPASERIEWEGGTVETANQWLLDKAGAFEAQQDAQKQVVIVLEIREYLSSVSFKLHELEKAAAAERNKDQDKQKLGEILRREEYQKPQEKQESAIQRWLREFLEWLESLFPKPNLPSEGFSGMAYIIAFLQILLYAALLGLLGFLLYKIIPLIFPQLKRTRNRKPKRQRTILGEQLGEDVTASNLFDEAERLARDGDLRGAIRKGYIALLCDLSDRKVIGLARDKTNRDYLRDVRSRGDLHPRLKSVTDTFERHWYGFQESAEQDWAQFRDEYDKAIRSV